ncbi:geminin coiled-coil domain-containing protein 1 [Trichomycterus rosablanca]|uniref:geminin coiled-coil domain-containing protein 1 n=1 Tax=Trichomycterus rosablanca TaxID=2290929 RepID=UPI002F34F455
MTVGLSSSDWPCWNKAISAPDSQTLFSARSTVLSCRDMLLAGDPHYESAYSASTTTRSTVDVSTATLWGTSHLNNARYQREHSQHVSLHDTRQESTWFYQLSPHLQHNKQLQNTLIQKEEELARLQEENNKLKEFFNSAYVKSLKEKSKKFLFVQRSSELRKRKRTLNEEDSLNVSQLLQDSEGIRTCRNLSPEFCLPKEVAVTPPLNSWILETLGLQDEGIVNADSCFSSPTTDQTSSFYSPITSIDQQSLTSPDMQNSRTCSLYPDSQSEYSSAKDSSFGVSHNMDTCTEYLTLDPSPLYTVSTGSQVNSLPAIVSTGHFTPPRAAPTPQHLDASKLWQHCNSHDFSIPPGGEGALFYVPHTAGSRMDLAFSMSLSPQNTVKTQSYPQGQAFTRRDSQGGWNFTWVPKHFS